MSNSKELQRKIERLKKEIEPRANKDIYISVCGVKTDSTDLPAHTIDSDTHIARMLSHHKAIVFIQIKHGVFGCKVHKQKRYVKVCLFRMVTMFVAGCKPATIIRLSANFAQSLYAFFTLKNPAYPSLTLQLFIY